MKKRYRKLRGFKKVEDSEQDVFRCKCCDNVTLTPTANGWLDFTIYRGWAVESVWSTTTDTLWLCSLCTSAIKATLFEKQLKGE